MRVALVRHPAVAWPPGLCYGATDVPLRDDPAALARLAAALAGARAACVWSSPASRCRVVAEAVAASRRLPVRLDARLRELDFGAWEGLRWDDIPRAALESWAAAPVAFAPPGGESGAALLARVGDFHAALLAHGRDCIVVAHGGPLKLLRALLRGEPPDLLAPPPPLGSVERLGG